MQEVIAFLSWGDTITTKLGVSDAIGLRLYPQNLTWLIPAEGSVD